MGNYEQRNFVGSAIMDVEKYGEQYRIEITITKQAPKELQDKKIYIELNKDATKEQAEDLREKLNTIANKLIVSD